MLGLWNLSASLFDLFVLDILFYYLFYLCILSLINLSKFKLMPFFLSTSVIDLQTMHKDFAILKIVILFCLLNSEYFFIFLDFYQKFLNHVNVNQ